MRITSVDIRPADSPLGDRGIWAVVDDSKGNTETGLLFTYDRHKLHFDETELIGLTVLEAHRLRHAKHRVEKR